MAEAFLQRHKSVQSLNLVPLAGKIHYVINTLCPLCKQGWNNMDNTELAIYRDVLYHAHCFKTRRAFTWKHKQKRIVRGFLSFNLPRQEKQK